MSRAEEIMRQSGSALVESARVRPAPGGLETVAASIGLKDPRKAGLDRSKNSWTVPLAKIERDPNQPREEFPPGEMERLAESLKTHGLIQPITIIWSNDLGHYRVVSGERRFRAAKLIGWETIACNVLDKPIGADELLALQIVENLMREDLKPIEQAKAFNVLLTVNGWSVTRIAKELGISHSAVSQSLRLITLPESVQDKIEDGVLSPVAGYHVAKIEDPEVQEQVAARVVAEGLTRDETVEAVRKAIEKAPRQAKSAKPSGQGRGAKPKPIKSRVFKTESGIRIIAERARGIDPAALEDALQEALDRVKADIAQDDQAAA